MDLLGSMNKAMRYIEDHLMEEEIDFCRVSRIAGCSEGHFRRMFSFLAGMPLSEYVRRRRLTLAAARLTSSNEKIIDLALRLGYSTPDAFAKAFQSFHGISPSRARSRSVHLKAFPPMTFQLTIKGGQEMNYRFEKKGAFQIVGVKKRVPLIFEGTNPHIEALAQTLTLEDIRELKSLCNEEPSGILSVSAHFEERATEGAELDQYIGVATTLKPQERWDVLQVEASDWAVFEVAGKFPEVLQETWARIYAEWFPTSGCEWTGGPEMLWNESPDTSLPDYKSEIWVPVIHKTKHD